MGKPALYVRALTDAERKALAAALRSSDAFVLRRAEILLASARREQVSTIAPLAGYSGQAVRLVIHAFHQEGVRVLQRRSTCSHTLAYCFDTPAAERLREILHQDPTQLGEGDQRVDPGVDRRRGLRAGLDRLAGQR